MKAEDFLSVDKPVSAEDFLSGGDTIASLISKRELTDEDRKRLAEMEGMPSMNTWSGRLGMDVDVDPVGAVTGGVTGAARSAQTWLGRLFKPVLGGAVSGAMEYPVGVAASSAANAVEDTNLPAAVKLPLEVGAGLAIGHLGGKYLEAPLVNAAGKLSGKAATAKNILDESFRTPRETISAGEPQTIDTTLEEIVPAYLRKRPALPAGQGFELVGEPVTRPTGDAEDYLAMDFYGKRDASGPAAKDIAASEAAVREHEAMLASGETPQTQEELLRDYYRKQEGGRQEWLQEAWGRIDGKKLAADYPDAYRELSRLYGPKMFAKGGLGVDELADELVTRGLLPQGSTDADLIEKLKTRGSSNDQTLYDITGAIAAKGRQVYDATMGRVTSDGDTVKDYLIRKLQDKFKPVKSLREQMADRYLGGVVPKQADPYLAEELFHGKVGYDLEAFEKGYVDPLVDGMARTGVKADELGEYLYALHAPERNALMATRNPEKFGGGGGSGMNDADALAIKNKYETDPRGPAFKELAAKVPDIRKLELDVRLQHGLISKETYDQLLSGYKNYVPLRGLTGVDDAPLSGGKGFDSRRSGLRTAYGRQSRADNPLVYMVGQVEEAIVQGRKNEVAQAFLNLVRQNPDIGKVNAVEFKPKIASDGTVVYNHTPPSANTDAVGAIENGRHYYVEANDPLVNKAMKNLGEQKAGAIVKFLGGANRYLAAVNTSFNPEFVLTNFSRDLQQAGINLSAEHSAGLAVKVAKDIPQAVKASWRGLRWEQPSTDWDRWFHEFRQAGGSMGYYRLDDFEQRAKTIEKSVARAGGKEPVRGAVSAFVQLIEDANGAVENAVRLSAYKNAREAGMPAEQAASLAKNLTVNFNRRGEWGQVMNSMYLFYNASIQGSARLIQTLKSPAGRKIAGTAFAASLGLAELNRELAGQDEAGHNYYDKIEPWVKDRNIILMLPNTGGKYVSIPAPIGFNVFHAAAQAMSDGLHGESTGKTALRMTGALLNAFNPVGGDENLLKSISPTATDPVVEIATNSDYAGRPIKPERMPGDLRPESELAFRGVNPITQSLMRGVNAATGGNMARPGAVDISPEIVDYMTDFLTGSAGATVSRFAGMVGNIIKREPPKDIGEVPFVRRFVGQPGEYWDQQRFRENYREAQTTQAEAEIYMREASQGKMSKDALDTFMAKNAPVMGMTKYGQKTSNQLAAIRKFRTTVENDQTMPAEERKQRLDSLEKQAADIVMQYNKAFNESEQRRKMYTPKTASPIY